MPHVKIKLHGYDITEEQFASLASEFFGEAQFPAGDHQVAHVRFTEQTWPEKASPAELCGQFLNALRSFKRPFSP